MSKAYDQVLELSINFDKISAKLNATVEEGSSKHGLGHVTATLLQARTVEAELKKLRVLLYK